MRLLPTGAAMLTACCCTAAAAATATLHFTSSQPAQPLVCAGERFRTTDSSLSAAHLQGEAWQTLQGLLRKTSQVTTEVPAGTPLTVALVANLRQGSGVSASRGRCTPTVQWTPSAGAHYHLHLEAAGADCQLHVTFSEADGAPEQPQPVQPRPYRCP